MREESRNEFGRSRLALNSTRSISRSAILAGVAVTLGVSLLLTLLGAGLGASSISPSQERNPFAGLGMAALVWMVVSGILAFFAGGWVAGQGSGWAATRREGLIHGAVTWAVASIVGVWLITGATGSLLSGGAGVIGQTISGAAGAASQAPQLSAGVREELKKRGIDVNSLEQQARSPENQAKAEQIARQAGETVAKGVSLAALGGFGMLLLNLFASLFGAMAVTRRTYGEVPAERAA